MVDLSRGFLPPELVRGEGDLRSQVERLIRELQVAHTALSSDVSTLDSEVEAIVDSTEDFESYTPTLTASSSNPTLGTGGGTFGGYVRVGGLVTGWARVAFGSSGVGAGTGAYILSLPVEADTTVSGMAGSSSAGSGSAIGSGHVRDDSAPANNSMVSVQLRTSTSVSLVQATGGFVTHSNPFGWAADDAIAITFTYPAVLPS